MHLAGVPIPDRLVLELGRRLRTAGLEAAAAKLEHAWSAETKVLALDIDDREALLRAMEDWCPPELGDCAPCCSKSTSAESGTASSSQARASRPG